MSLNEEESLDSSTTVPTSPCWVSSRREAMTRYPTSCLTGCQAPTTVRVDDHPHAPHGLAPRADRARRPPRHGRTARRRRVLRRAEHRAHRARRGDLADRLLLL